MLAVLLACVSIDTTTGYHNFLEKMYLPRGHDRQKKICQKSKITEYDSSKYSNIPPHMSYIMF